MKICVGGGGMQVDAFDCPVGKTQRQRTVYAAANVTVTADQWIRKRQFRVELLPVNSATLAGWQLENGMRRQSLFRGRTNAVSGFGITVMSSLTYCYPISD